MKSSINFYNKVFLLIRLRKCSAILMMAKFQKYLIKKSFCKLVKEKAICFLLLKINIKNVLEHLLHVDSRNLDKFLKLIKKRNPLFLVLMSKCLRGFQINNAD